jgi:nucleotide-binding universal stress UspA family protein
MAVETTKPLTEPAQALDELHIRRLLVAVDGSAAAELALRAAITAGLRDNAAITLLVVVPDLLAAPPHWAVTGAADPATLQRDIDDDACKLLRDLVARLPDDLPVKTRIRRGKPGPEICAQAKECGEYDAILLGARGVGRVGALTGSVSSYVMHHADTSVIVVHPPRTDA